MDIVDSCLRRLTHLGCHADDEPLLFDLVRLDGIIVLQDLARVDELLRRWIPSFLCTDLLLDRADGVARLSLDGELLLLQVLERELHDGRSARAEIARVSIGEKDRRAQFAVALR